MPHDFERLGARDLKLVSVLKWNLVPTRLDVNTRSLILCTTWDLPVDREVLGVVLVVGDESWSSGKVGNIFGGKGAYDDGKGILADGPGFEYEVSRVPSPNVVRLARLEELLADG